MYMNKNTHLPLSYAPTSLQQLIWHDGTIPENEVWVKLGGDKGKHTFKMNFQIVNVPHPNSIHNTCVCCVRSKRFSNESAHCIRSLQISDHSTSEYTVEVRIESRVY